MKPDYYVFPDLSHLRHHGYALIRRLASSELSVFLTPSSSSFHDFFMISITTRLFSLVALAACALAAPLEISGRDVFVPPVTYPHAGTVWHGTFQFSRITSDTYLSFHSWGQSQCYMVCWLVVLSYYLIDLTYRHQGCVASSETNHKLQRHNLASQRRHLQQ